MKSLVELGRQIMPTFEHPYPERPGAQLSDLTRDFIETLTFAEADEILAMLRELFAEEWICFPVWARHLAFRLVCLQRPDDGELLREAAGDLFCFGPDWDDHAEELLRRADALDAAEGSGR